MRRRHFLFAAAFLGSIAAASVVAFGAAVGMSAAPPTCSGTPQDDPIMTTLLFIHDVVEGHNVARGFGIVTPGLRGYSTTCTGWVAGTKVKRFHNVDWNRSSYKLSVAATEQRIYLVKLFSTVHGVAPRTFEIELRQPPGGGPWSVDAWLDS